MRRNPLDGAINAAVNRAAVNLGRNQGLGAPNAGSQVNGGLNLPVEGAWVAFGLLDVTALGSFRLAGSAPASGLGRLDVTLFSAPWRLAPTVTAGKLNVSRLIDPFVLS